MFSSVIRQFIFGTLHLLSVASTRVHTHTHTPIDPCTHTHSSCERLTTHCVLTVAACLLNDQCVYMKSYHWAVCSTDKGHVILCSFFNVLFFGGGKRWEWFQTDLLGFSSMEAYCTLVGGKIQNMFCYSNKTILLLYWAVSPPYSKTNHFWDVTVSSLSL